jgi:hypothetical protein
MSTMTKQVHFDGHARSRKCGVEINARLNRDKGVI